MWRSNPLHWSYSCTHSQEQGTCCYDATRWTGDGWANDATTYATNATACTTNATASATNATRNNPARVRIRTEVIILLRPHTTSCCMMGK